MTARLFAVISLFAAACAAESVPAEEPVVAAEDGGASTTAHDAGSRPAANGPDASSVHDAGFDAAVVHDAGADVAAEAAAPETVPLHVLTYNVAGLPQGISGSNPQTNMPLISPLLNPFELVLVQEDFTYHDKLIADVTFPYLSETVALQDQSDGLNTLSRLPFSSFTRTGWTHCNGYIDQANDCLTKKGFTRAVLDLGAGRTLDFYDAHFDAGRSAADYAARQKQVVQLVAAIDAQSAGHAVLVAGDTNMKAEDEVEFVQLLTDAGLTCACRALDCAEPSRIDRVLFRSGGGVTLTAVAWQVEQGFVDAEGAQLSDHAPVSVRLEAR